MHALNGIDVPNGNATARVNSHREAGLECDANRLWPEPFKYLQYIAVNSCNNAYAAIQISPQ